MSEEESTERKQVFVGTIRKCPNCGAQITTDVAKCPSCGFIIEKKNVSSAMEEFVQKFTAISVDAEKKEYIESYPVPNNKEDIRGFLNYAASQRDKDYTNNKLKVFWVDAWNNKCRQIVNQAIDVFGADSEFTQYLRAYKADVEKSSTENRKLKNKLLFTKISKISAVVVVVLAVAGIIGGILYSNKKKRAELIAGCVVPKENVVIIGEKNTEAISDARIVTTNISQRAVTDSKTPVWCLDTTVTVEVRSKGNLYETALEKSRIGERKEFYSSPDYEKSWFRTILDEENIDCAYQSKSVIDHSFDNVHSVTELLLNKNEENANMTLTIRLTQVAGSREECEDLAIQLHESGEFKFLVLGFIDQYYNNWKNRRNS